MFVVGALLSDYSEVYDLTCSTELHRIGISTITGGPVHCVVSVIYTDQCARKHTSQVLLQNFTVKSGVLFPPNCNIAVNIAMLMR